MNTDINRENAAAAGLAYTPADRLPIRRRRCGRGFVYFDADGKVVRDPAALARFRSLAIPPAYRDVRIADDPLAHLQAVGVDDAGRLQYRYHPGWEVVREEQKREHLAEIARAIPRIRAHVARDLKEPAGKKALALAAVVLVLDRTHIRIGCEGYVHSGRSRGAATLLKRQVRVEGDQVALAFRGKGGHEIACTLTSPALARAVEKLCSLRGRRLFQYADERGRLHRVTAADVNAYLRQAAHGPVTAKDFRTLAANAEAGLQFVACERPTSATKGKRQVAAVMRDVAKMLANTPAVARKSYVHARLVDAYMQGSLTAKLARSRPRARQRKGEALVEELFSRNGGR